jgi:hypothetical protein
MLRRDLIQGRGFAPDGFRKSQCYVRQRTVSDGLAR